MSGEVAFVVIVVSQFFADFKVVFLSTIVVLFFFLTIARVLVVAPIKYEYATISHTNTNAMTVEVTKIFRCAARSISHSFHMFGKPHGVHFIWNELARCITSTRLYKRSGGAVIYRRANIIKLVSQVQRKYSHCSHDVIEPGSCSIPEVFFNDWKTINSWWRQSASNANARNVYRIFWSAQSTAIEHTRHISH